MPNTTLRALNVLKRIPSDHFAENIDGASVIARRDAGSKFLGGENAGLTDQGCSEAKRL
jgi:hypothetical protein